MLPCQQCKVYGHNPATLQSFLLPDSQFSAIHCDSVGPLSESFRDAYLLTIIDRFTLHLECIPLHEITAKARGDPFILNKVAVFGCPLVITCDMSSSSVNQPPMGRAMEISWLQITPHNSLPS